MSDDAAWNKLGRLLPGPGTPAVGALRTKAPKLETFGKAKLRLLGELSRLGWDVQDGLKVPHATSPDRRIRLWFKPQAVWYTGSDHHSGFRHDFHAARTISYSLDTRRLSAPSLVAMAQDRVQRDLAHIR